MKKVLFYIWQLPQHLLALCIIPIFDCHRLFSLDTYTSLYCSSRFSFFGGVSLGNYIIVNTTHKRIPIIKHEHGHSKQSRLLGPFYLLLVGIPSVILNILCRLNIIDPKKYYTFYPENWANKLGGVKI